MHKTKRNGRPRFAVALALAALSLAGCRELTSPADGFLIVDSVDSPVLIRTKDLEGAGYINALDASKQWKRIHFSPGGAFLFNEPLPPEAWHCKRGRGCVAALRVGDDKGFFPTPKQGRIYVCTADYLQGSGRKHCGPRSIELRELVSVDPDGRINVKPDWNTHYPRATRTDDLAPTNYARNWQGDGAQRLFNGFHVFENSNNAWDPAFPSDSSGSWREIPWQILWNTPPLAESTFVSGSMMSVDIGASRVFVPWRGEHYIEGSAAGALISNALGGLGLAEILIERLRENPIAESIYTQDAIRWLNVLTGIWERTDVSPEFHFRVTDDGERQICLVQYVAANNRINARPDSWWRFDQGFAALFIQWFGLGDCKTHNARIQYCGSLDLDDGVPQYSIDPSSVVATMEPYPKIRPLCRKRFKPEFESSIPDMLIEPAQAAITDGLALLIGSFEGLLGAEVRRVETTPTGVYLVLAETVLDPQYGIGDSTAELEKSATSFATQPAVTLPSVPATGITRPIQ